MTPRRPLALRLANAALAGLWRVGAGRLLLLICLTGLLFAVWRYGVDPTLGPLKALSEDRAEQAALGDPDCRLSADLAMRHGDLLAPLDVGRALDAYFDAFTLHADNASLARAARLARDQPLTRWADGGRTTPAETDQAFAAVIEALDRDDAAAAEDALKAGLRAFAAQGQTMALAFAYEYLARLTHQLGDPSHRVDVRMRWLWRSIALFQALDDQEAVAWNMIDLAHALDASDLWRGAVVMNRLGRFSQSRDLLGDAENAAFAGLSDAAGRNGSSGLFGDVDADGCAMPPQREAGLHIFVLHTQRWRNGLAVPRYKRAPPAIQALISAYGRYRSRETSAGIPGLSR